MIAPYRSQPVREFGPGEILDERLVRDYLKSCGRSVKIFAGCRLFPSQRISIGDFSQIDEGVQIFAANGVELGCYVHLAVQSSILGGGECVIGDFAGIGAGVRLITGTEVVVDGGLTNPTVPDESRAVQRGRIEIGAHAIVFTNSIVLPDVNVGEGAIVAAGSLVHRNLEPWSVYAGNPLVQVGVRRREPVLEKGRQVLSELERVGRTAPCETFQGRY